MLLDGRIRMTRLKNLLSPGLDVSRIVAGGRLRMELVIVHRINS